MKKAINLLVAGFLLGAFATTSDSINTYSSVSFAVEAAPAMAFVTGTVKDEQGGALMGAIVAVLEPRPRGKEIKSVKTDAQGRFSAGVTPGIYFFRATYEGFRSQIARLNVNSPGKNSYNFALKKVDTLVQRRGDSNDIRWVANSVPRNVLNFENTEEEVVEQTDDIAARNNIVASYA